MTPPSARIWWDKSEKRTPEAVEQLGGKAVVEAAVARVLPDRRVKLRVIAPGISGAVVFLASPQSEHEGRRVSEVDGVLKVGPAQLLADEVGRYDKWVRHVLHRASHFPLLDAPPDVAQVAVADPGHIEALNYRHAGHTTFGDRVRELLANNDLVRAGQILDAVFTILRPWQEMVEPDANSALTGDGVYSFGTDPFEEFERTCARLNDRYAAADAIDPALYAAVREIWAPDALMSERQLKSIVHGDLHIDNILIGAEDAPTLIDFGAAGEGHFLRDLSTLEAHLVLRALAPPSDDITDEHRAYLEELRPLYLSGVFLDPRIGHPTPLQALILRLRRYALYCLMRCETDYLPQYAIGVLRHAIRICTRPEATFTDAQRWIAGQVSAMLRDVLAVDKNRLVLRDTGGFRATAMPAILDVVPDGSVGDVGLPIAEPCPAETWRRLAASLRSARRVDFVGIVPVQLISAILDEWDASEGSPLPRVHYLTQPQVSAADTSSPPASIWKAALTGMRNIANRVSNAQVAIDRFAKASRGVPSNCLIRRTGADDHTTLYLAGQVSASEVLENSYVVSEVVDSDGRISDWITETSAVASPIIIREVDCWPYEDATPDPVTQFAAPEILRLSPYGDAAERSSCLRPIALTVLRTRGPRGRQVLLKMRSPLADNDDFGRLSFFSARILADDVAVAHGASPVHADDAEDACDQLWQAIGSPESFVLSERVFVQAARRDLFGTTLLDIDPDRFTFRGMHVMNREDGRIQLGFAVLTVDLTPEEVSSARRAGRVTEGGGNELLRLAPVRTLFDGSLPVNRFMRTQKDWLLEHCLGPHVT